MEDNFFKLKRRCNSSEIKLKELYGFVKIYTKSKISYKTFSKLVNEKDAKILNVIEVFFSNKKEKAKEKKLTIGEILKNVRIQKKIKIPKEISNYKVYKAESAKVFEEIFPEILFFYSKELGISISEFKKYVIKKMKAGENEE